VDVDRVLLAGQARALAEAIDAYRGAEDRAGAGQAQPLLAQAGLALAGGLASLQERLWARLFRAERTFNCQEAGLMLQGLYPQALEVLGRLDGLLTEEAGASAGEFRQAHARLTTLHEEFRRDWPLFDPAELEEADRAIARGECVRVEDMLRELDDPV
jgi:hypothetical protein